MDAYPLLTKPHFQDYIWGGRSLESKLSKKIPSEGIWAESWEIVDHAEHQSVVTNGELTNKTLRDICHEHREWMFGNSDLRAIPLLLKYLDCQRVLSVQVHPADAFALKMNPPDLGKTEAWYILSVEPGAVLYAGMREGVSRSQLADAIAKGECESCLHVIEPQAGDCVFIPAGTVHALGAGLLVAEIQQASNTTFRLFDWNRLGSDGKPRPLHIDQALEVIDFDAGPRPLQSPERMGEGHERLVACDKFVLDRYAVGSHQLANVGRFEFVTVPVGSAELKWTVSGAEHSQVLRQGESAVLPAALTRVTCQLTKDAVMLEMYLP